MAKFHVSMPDALRDDLAARGPISTMITRDLERYHALLGRVGRELHGITDDEWLMLRDATIGTTFEPWSIPHVAAAVQDAYPAASELHAKLSQLSDAARFALVDRLERLRTAGG